jgi:SPP1 gp7 family putative phage head morphogenesis protein
LVDAVLSTINKANSYEDLDGFVAKHLKRSLVIPIANNMADIAFYAYLVGVYNIIQDVNKEKNIQYRSNIQYLLFEDIVEHEIGSEVLVHPEAIAFFKSKIPMSNKEFISKYNKLHDRYFTIAGVDSEKTLQEIQDAITDSLKKGTSFQDFKKVAKKLVDETAITALNANKLDLVYRNAVLGAYGYGKLDQLLEPETRKFLQYWTYVGVMDKRIRPEHEKLHGITLPNDDPFWKLYYPPWAHRCRCTVKAFSKGQIEGRGITLSDTDDMDLPPPSNFQNPMQSWLKASKQIGKLAPQLK